MQFCHTTDEGVRWSYSLQAEQAIEWLKTLLSERPAPQKDTQSVEEIKDWIETALDADAHGKWVRSPQFHIIEDVAELMAPRIHTLLTHLSQEAEERDRFVLGWRERDWQEGFDRKTAQMIAEKYEQRFIRPHQ